MYYNIEIDNQYFFNHICKNYQEKRAHMALTKSIMTFGVNKVNKVFNLH